MFLNLRLRRLGVISGIIWDENEIGLPDQEVLAYRPTRPPVVAAKAKTDDRGAFRITGLAPGAYLVRTAAHPLDEWTGVLPTFYREVVTVDDARTVDTDLDHETPDIDFRPNFGKLVRLSGRAVTFPPVSLTVELISDMGKVTTTTGGNGQFSFESVAPGDYELLAHGFRGGMIAGYEPVHVEKDLEVVTLPVNQLPVVRPVFEMQDGTPVDPKLITIVGRRKALSGEGPGEVLTASGAGRRSDQFEVLPGRWRILVLTPPNLYPVSMSRAKGRIDGWTEVDFGESRTDRLRIVLSDRPGSIRGKVTGPGQEPAAAAPVYLEAYDADAHRRLLDPRSVRTDLRGDYSFRGLPPGHYRIMSTFEIENPDEKQMDYANCPVVTVKEGEEVVRDLAIDTAIRASIARKCWGWGCR